MPNLFEEGVPTSPSDLVAKITTFASTVAGFTISSYNDGTYDIIRLTKNGMSYRFIDGYFILSGQNYISCYMSAESSDTPWRTEATRTFNPCRFWLSETTGPYVRYWCFTEPTQQVVHTVVELQPGVYNHLSFGVMDKAGSYTGGEYMVSGWYLSKTGSNPVVYRSYIYFTHTVPFGSHNASSSHRNYVHNDIGAGGSANFASTSGEVSSQRAYMGGRNGITNYLSLTGVSAIAHRTPLIPIYCFLLETNDDLYWPAGVIPGVTECRLDILNPQEITNDDWQVFPLCEKDGNEQNGPNTEKFGLAYRRYVV